MNPLQRKVALLERAADALAAERERAEAAAEAQRWAALTPEQRDRERWADFARRWAPADCGEPWNVCEIMIAETGVLPAATVAARRPGYGPATRAELEEAAGGPWPGAEPEDPADVGGRSRLARCAAWLLCVRVHVHGMTLYGMADIDRADILAGKTDRALFVGGSGFLQELRPVARRALAAVQAIARARWCPRDGRTRAALAGAALRLKAKVEALDQALAADDAALCDLFNGVRADALARGGDDEAAKAEAAEACADTMEEARRRYAADLRTAAAGGPCKPWVADAAPGWKDPEETPAAELPAKAGA